MADTNVKLTRRQLEILPLVAQGRTNIGIAKRLWLTENTVKTHVRHALIAFNVDSREHMVAMAIRAGLLPVERVQPDDARRAIAARHERVLALMSQGDNTEVIAKAIGCSRHNVQALVNELLLRWHCRNRAHLILRAFQFGVLKAPAAATR